MLPALDADDLRARLPADCLLGREIVVLAATDSTNDVVCRAGADGAGEGLAVFAESQRAGRGRQGRRWESRPGLGLWFSLLLRPIQPRVHWSSLALWAALGVAEAAEAETGAPAAIKWPNDVLVAGRKVAGILIETHAGRAATAGGDFAVAGIGINVGHRAEDFPPDLRARAGSLAQAAAGRPLDRAALAAAVLGRLEAGYRVWQTQPDALVAACSRRCSLRGRRVRSTQPGGPEGIVEGFVAAGHLLLRCDVDATRWQTVASGEIIVL